MVHTVDAACQGKAHLCHEHSWHENDDFLVNQNGQDPLQLLLDGRFIESGDMIPVVSNDVARVDEEKEGSDNGTAAIQHDVFDAEASAELT